MGNDPIIDPRKDPDAPWLVELESWGHDFDPQVADRIAELGAAAVVPLVRRIEWSLAVEDDQSFAPMHAARLLGRIGDARGVDPLTEALEATEPGDTLWEAAVLTLPKFGAPAVGPALARAMALDPDDPAALGWADVVSRAGVREERIFALLLDMLPHFPDFVAGCFGDYGDPRALPILHDWLEGHALTGDVVRDQVVVEFGAAIETLGDDLTATERLKLDEFHERRRDAYAQPATKRERPGRNEPCWCGSGKKYKKCHLRSDNGLA